VCVGTKNSIEKNTCCSIFLLGKRKKSRKKYSIFSQKKLEIIQKHSFFPFIEFFPRNFSRVFYKFSSFINKINYFQIFFLRKEFPASLSSPENLI